MRSSRLRTLRRLHPLAPYATCLLAVAAALAALAVPVVGRSDWWNTRATVAAAPPRAVEPAPLPDTVRPRWSAAASDSIAGADPGGGTGTEPVVGSTVVLAGRHALSGRDPMTGKERWRYERRNATLCGWEARDGIAVAVFRHGEECGDVVALDGDTGRRRWYRNADVGAHVTLSSAPGVVVLGDGTKLVAFYTDSGLERWAYTKAGCRFGAPVAGDVGVAVVLDCDRQSPLLALHDLASKEERWSVPLTSERARVLAVAGGRIAVYGSYQGSPALTVYDSRGSLTGAATGADLAADTGATPTATVWASTLVTWTGSRLLGIDLNHATVAWSVPATGPATLDIDVDAVVCSDRAGFAQVSPLDGRVVQRLHTSGGRPPEGTRLARVGATIVASGPEGTAVYG